MTAIVIGYFGVASVLMLRHGQWLSPDQFIIVGFLLALLLAKPLVFLKDWAPFVLLFLGYEYLRGLAPQLGLQVHIMPLDPGRPLAVRGHTDHPAAERLLQPRSIFASTTTSSPWCTCCTSSCRWCSRSSSGPGTAPSTIGSSPR